MATTCPGADAGGLVDVRDRHQPGGHGIFDFLRRDPKTYRPDIALNRHEPAGAFRPPKAVNLRRGTAVWDVLASRGVDSTILRCPATYPPAATPWPDALRHGRARPPGRVRHGHALLVRSGDARALEGERLVRGVRRLQRPDRHPGHRPKPTPGTARTWPRRSRSTSTRSPGPRPSAPKGLPAGLVVLEGAWSDWLRVSFKAGLFQTVRGIVRFYLARVGPTFELYASPVNFDPEAPAFPISHPPEFSREMAEELGPFHTTGWSRTTAP